MVAVIDEVCSDVKAQMEADFGPPRDEEGSEHDVLAWLHYRARSIPQRFREVVLSGEVKAAMSRFPAIAQIKHQLANAGDVRPWLSNSIRDRKSDPLADKLFNDWQITHFHLGTFDKSGIVSRADDLLFAHVTAHTAVLIAIRSHQKTNRWTEQSILESLLQSYPPFMEIYELKNVHGSRDELSDVDYARARRANESIPFQKKDRVFVIGGGLARSGHSARLGEILNYTLRTYRNLNRHFINNQFSVEEFQRLLFPIGLPVRLGCRLPFYGQIELWDKNRMNLLWASRPLE